MMFFRYNLIFFYRHSSWVNMFSAYPGITRLYRNVLKSFKNIIEKKTEGVQK